MLINVQIVSVVNSVLSNKFSLLLFVAIVTSNYFNFQINFLLNLWRRILHRRGGTKTFLKLAALHFLKETNYMEIKYKNN
jgi:hypothetical protein